MPKVTQLASDRMEPSSKHSLKLHTFPCSPMWRAVYEVTSGCGEGLILGQGSSKSGKTITFLGKRSRWMVMLSVEDHRRRKGRLLGAIGAQILPILIFSNCNKKILH